MTVSGTSGHPKVAAETGPAQMWRNHLRAGGRVTRARLLVLETLNAADEHLTAADVHERISLRTDGINMSTVYRTMVRLEELGLVHQLDAQGVAKYGVANHPHHHAVCGVCQRVTELAAADVNNALNVLAEATGIHPDPASSLTVRVTCVDCLDAAQAIRRSLSVDPPTDSD